MNDGNGLDDGCGLVVGILALVLPSVMYAGTNVVLIMLVVVVVIVKMIVLMVDVSGLRE